MNVLAVIAIVIKNTDSAEKVNALLHDAGKYIVGRMGLPYKERGVNIINVVLDAPQEVINSLSGKLGMLDNVKAKVLVTK